MAKSTAEENSERKRISIPKADESVLAWWDAQKDVGLSIRLLIRTEIERNGYTDTAYRPVAQLPRRGRPAGIGGESEVEETEDSAGTFSAESAAHAPAPAAAAAAPAPVAAIATAPGRRAAERAATQPASEDGFSAIDDLMNG